MHDRYNDKVALVTGGGSGLGEAFCHRLAREGATVAVLDVDARAAEQVATAIRAASGDALSIAADVSDVASMQNAVDSIVSRCGRLDVAVNNAGVGGGMYPLSDFPPDEWTRTIMVNLVGVFFSMRAEIPAMLASGGGSIVNIASIASVKGQPMVSAYVAAKHGVLGLTRSAAVELGARNIRVNAVAPTWVPTPMTNSVMGAADWAKHAADHPLGRVATPEDIAEVVAFLGSNASSIVTGSLYMADGGLSAL